MFWITNNENEPLVETVYFLEKRKSKKYPMILINENTNNIKYNNKCGIMLKKEKIIIWDDASEWILAPKKIELVEGKFKNISSLFNIEVCVPMSIYNKNYKNMKFIPGKICGICENNTFTLLIGNYYYYNIKPGVLKIKLPKFN